MPSNERRITIILFDQFQLLDVFGPVELMSKVPGVTIDYAGPVAGPVRSSQGAPVITDLAHSELHDPDIILVPGGAGTRPLTSNLGFLTWLSETAQSAQLVTSVCTGSALLAAAGALDGYRATSNKFAFDWASSFGADVDWVTEARWVEDRDRWTSSGVAAGMDMAAAFIERLFGAGAATKATQLAEYQPQTDPTYDPFATLHGLV